MKDALQLIAAKSPAASQDAMDTLRAIRVKSPMVQTRYERTVEAAFRDPDAEFSEDERALIASYLSLPGGSEPPTRMRTVRLSGADWQLAQDIGDGSAAAGIRTALHAYRRDVPYGCPVWLSGGVVDSVL